MHDLNLEEMVFHRMTIPLHPTGKLKVQFQYLEDRTSLTVIIIEVSNYEGLVKFIYIVEILRMFRMHVFIIFCLYMCLEN